MGIRSRFAAGAILMFVVGLAVAQNPTDCAAVQFSEAVLERFPQAREACLDVISRAGQEYAVFNARLTQVQGNTMRVRFRLPDGSFGPTTTVRPPADFRVLIDGEPIRVRDVAPNQDLKAYVHVSRPEVAIEPADAAQELLIVPLAVTTEPVAEEGDADGTQLAEAQEDPEMPATAGRAPVFATFGLLLACAALGLRAVRGVRALRKKQIERIPS